MKNLKHFVRYGTSAEQKYIVTHQDLFDGVVVNANMLIHASKSISMFLYKDVSKKPFFIDPITHAFQHELKWIYNDDGKLKKSIEKLINEYGGLIQNTILELKRPLRSSDFNENNLSEFADSVLNFQYNFVEESIDEEYKDYLEYLGETRKPEILIAPYFYMTNENFDNWITINEKLIQLSMENKSKYSSIEIFAQIVITKEILSDSTKVNQIIKYTSLADGILYWIDGFDESRATYEQLKNLLQFINSFKTQNSNKLVVSLYGGYFSQLLLKKDLDGVVHGLEYGEKREVVPVGGGIPRAKFYIPALKQRFDATSVIPLLSYLKITDKNQYKNELCDCVNCDNVIQNDSYGLEDITRDFSIYLKTKQVKISYKNGAEREVEFPIVDSKEQCLFHYLHVKHQEYRNIEQKVLKELLLELEENYTKFESMFAENELDYLKRWYKVLIDE